MPADPYKTLGLERSATEDEVQKAYRKLARKYHPDMNPDDASAKQKFQEVQLAFETLSDPEKRKRFDQFGHAADHMGGGQGGPRWTYSTGPQMYPDLNDLFGAGDSDEESGGGFADFLRHMRRGSGQRRQAAAEKGADLKSELTVPFNTAVLGGEAALSIRRATGKVETIKLKIPAGIDDGKRIRLRGQGEPGDGGAPAGDILITVHVSPHPYFKRTGTRLDVRVPVTLAEAAQGGKIDVPTPYGTIALTLPPGTSSGTRLRAKGQGVRPKSGTPGDLFAEILIDLPDDLSEDDRKQLAEISEKYPQNPRRDLRW